MVQRRKKASRNRRRRRRYSDASSSSELSTSSITLTQPSPWKEYQHLNGSVYYYNHILRLITTDDIHNPWVLADVLEAMAEHVAALKDEGLFEMLPKDLEITIFGMRESVGACIDMQSCETGLTYSAPEEGGLKTHLNKSNFWSHIVEFPMHRSELPRNAEAQFLSALGRGDQDIAAEVSETNTFPFNAYQIKRLMHIYNDLKTLQYYDVDVMPALTWHIATVMREIEHDRERYDYGTNQARTRQNTVQSPTWGVRTWDFTMFFLFWGVHENYRSRLLSVQPEGFPYIPEFRQLIQSFLKEWADSNLVATVFISANVAFLAIPDINSLQRTASLVSSLFAMMSVITGLHNIWLHRDKATAEYDDAFKYLHRKYKSNLDVHYLIVTSCFLSFPLAFLLWSVTSFVIAGAAFAIQKSVSSDARIVLAVLLGLLGAASLMTFLFFWHIWNSPQVKKKKNGVRSGVGTAASRLRDRLAGIPMRWFQNAQKDVEVMPVL